MRLRESIPLLMIFGLIGGFTNSPGGAAPVQPSGAPAPTQASGAAPTEQAKPAPPAAKVPSAEKHYDMTTFQFVLLKTGPNKKPLPKEESDKMQKDHLDGLKALMDQKKALILGPLQDGGDIEGIVVLNVASTEEAKTLFTNDAWVRSGYLIAEVHPWWAAKGILRTAPEFMDLEPCQLGLLMRPKDAPQLPEAKLKEIQDGHMANINAMADSGDLVIAGPMGDDTALRGIFVFRTTSADHVRELVARDPAIKSGRLEMKLYTWLVSKGILPPA